MIIGSSEDVELSGSPSYVPAETWFKYSNEVDERLSVIKDFCFPIGVRTKECTDQEQSSYSLAFTLRGDQNQQYSEIHCLALIFNLESARQSTTTTTLSSQVAICVAFKNQKLFSRDLRCMLEELKDTYQENRDLTYIRMVIQNKLQNFKQIQIRESRGQNQLEYFGSESCIN